MCPVLLTDAAVTTFLEVLHLDGKSRSLLLFLLLWKRCEKSQTWRLLCVFSRSAWTLTSAWIFLTPA